MTKILVDVYLSNNDLKKSFNKKRCSSSSQTPFEISYDQENLLEFEPKTTTTAGSLRLSSGSEVIAGTKTRQEVVVWTDTAI